MTRHSTYTTHVTEAQPSARAGAMVGALAVAFLCACGGGGENPREEKDTTIYPPVTVTPAYHDDNPQAGVPLQFTGGDCGGGNGRLKAVWTFGDSQTSVNPTSKTHTYAAPGFYSFRVVCTDSQDGSATKYSTHATTTTYITVYP